MRPCAKKTRGGVLLVALLLLLLFFGVLAGMQTLVVIQAGLSTRALALGHLRSENRHRVRLAVQEAAQSSLDAGDLAGLEAKAGMILERLGCGQDAVRLQDFGTFQSGRSWLPMLEMKRSFLDKAGDVLPIDFPTLGLRGTDRVEVFSPALCHARAFAVDGQGAGEEIVLEVRSVGVPLCARSECFYELPSEIGQTARQGTEAGAGLGFKVVIGEAGGDQLNVAEALPYYFRQKTSLAQTYARLFSTTAVSRLLAAAGPEGFVVLKQGQVTGGADFVGLNAVCAGVKLESGALPKVLVVAAQDSSLELAFSDQVQGALLPPMVVLVLGQPQAPVRVSLSTCSRQVLLIGINIILTAAEGTQWSGGVVLSPGSRVDPGTNALRLSHFSCHLSGAPGQGVVRADLQPDAALVSLYPRTYYAGVRELW